MSNAPKSQPHFDLHAAAHRVAVENGFEPREPADATAQLAHLAPSPIDAALGAGARDLRALLWSSIDNDSSKDLDQIEVAESLADGAIRMLVGIADVDTLVRKGSPIDGHAEHNATTLYTGVDIFPMLPNELSTGLTSLGQGEDRLAIVIEAVVSSAGEVRSTDVFRAVVHNRAKLAYDDVGAWLEGTGTSAAVSAVQGLADQLRLQYQAAKLLKDVRLRAGALELDTIEATPVTQNGQVLDLQLTRKGPARDLIEDFMIAANTAIAKFLQAHGSPGIRRIVREPERWDRIVELAKGFGETLPATPNAGALAQFLSKRRAADPLRFPDLSLSVVKLMGPGQYALDAPGQDPGGHFALAAHDYTHGTAPNRRYADLITQRLVKAVLGGTTTPYSIDELSALAAHCTEREDAARKVERQMRKIVAALMLQHRIGESFDAIVTGVNAHGTFARLLHPPAEGMVVRGEQGMDVGEKVRLRLVRTDPSQGYVDFAGDRKDGGGDMTPTGTHPAT